MPERSGKEADPPSRVKIPMVAVVLRVPGLAAGAVMAMVEPVGLAGPAAG